MKTEVLIPAIRERRAQNKSALEIATDLGVGRHRVARLIHIHGLTLPRRRCRLCESWFSPDRPAGQYCTRRHQEKASDLKEYHHIEPEVYGGIWRAQGGRCANPGCRCVLPLVGREVHVDHNHETGVVRRLLCGSCNVAYGMLAESRDRILGLANLAEEDHAG